MRQFRSKMLPDQLRSRTLLVNWDLELSKSILVEKIQKLKHFCLQELNHFIDNLTTPPLLGKFEDFLLQVDQAKTFRALEHLVLRLIDLVDDAFENLIARGEQVVPGNHRALPRVLNLPALRCTVNTYFVESILPLFVSEYVVAPIMRSHR